MNLLKFLSIIFILVTISHGTAKAAALDPKQPENVKCSYQPCPNTPTGEDPALRDLREGDRLEKAARESENDTKRWKLLRLYSDTTNPVQLKMPVIKSKKFEMELIPKSGVIRFSMPGHFFAFRIASPAGDAAQICPFYNLKVHDAGDDYAIIRKSCPRYEYVSNRFHTSAEYFLFDARTSSMRALWFAARSTKDAPFPDASPPIKLARIPTGFRFDWSGIFPDDNSPEILAISNSYTREKDQSGLVLVCTDLKVPKAEGRENEMCEGRVLERVAN